LAADIVLMVCILPPSWLFRDSYYISQPNQNPYSHYSFKHRILGTISLDSPFLGLHPGIIVSGITSLFRPAETPMTSPPQGSLHQTLSTQSIQSTASPSLQLSQSSGSELTPLTSQSSMSVAQPGPSDPTFNAPFFNDMAFREQPFMARMIHFAKKHKEEGFFNAAQKHILSHLEFGGILADYPGLNARYNKIRALENVDDLSEDPNPNPTNSQRPRPVKVRFVNYYTISTGRIKPPDSPSPTSPTNPMSPHLRPGDIPTAKPRSATSSVASSVPATPRISIEDHSDSGRPTSLELINPEDHIILEDIEHEHEESGKAPESAPENPETTDNLGEDADLPPIPNLPETPQAPDLDKYIDKNLRKQAEKEAKRVQKAYDQAVKDRDKALKERQKLIQKRKKKAEQEAQKLEKEEQKRLVREEWAAQQKKEAARALSASATFNKENRSSTLGGEGAAAPLGPDGKPKKERKFCTLPRKVNGKGDETWVRVFMVGVDEVGAHCGLFFSGDHYERLVGDVGERIVGWVHDDLTKRAIREMAE
jgi:hypothetical protein